MSAPSPEIRRRHPVRQCRGIHCHAEIVFLRNHKTGALVPCDAATVRPSDHWFDRAIHTPHHATCADRETFRKPKE